MIQLECGCVVIEALNFSGYFQFAAVCEKHSPN